MERSDQELLDAIRKGDHEAFRKLVIKYEQRVASTITGMIGACPEADDIGQETFIRFYKSLNSFRGDSSLLTYLTRIAINLSLNELKRRKRRNFFVPVSIQEVKNHINMADSAEKTEIQDMVQKALTKLQPKFKTVIILRLIDGFSTKETADILRLPEGTVLSRLSRAQKKLKEILGPILGEESE